jgi:glycosyltransferase involved in cell wall biosynthesis
MPRVSVIIATYNWSSVLPYSIGSVLRQTFADFEVLVVGDGCTDDSEQVVRNIGDPRVQWFNLPTNTGHQGGPNNEGLRRARGEIIAYLGHDDLWFPHHLQTAIRAFDDQHADVAYALVASIGPDDRFVLPCVPQPRRGLFSPPSGMLHRREVTERAGGWRNYRDLRIGPETDLFRRANEMGCTFVPVSRLGALKFPAIWREGVYRTRPSHEQAAWTLTMLEDAALEASVMARIIAECGMRNVSYLDLVRQLLKETARRVSRPSFLPWRRGGMIEAARSYKGL